MTCQLKDSVCIDGNVYCIIKENCYPLFSPRHHGIGVASMGTWCWRGYLVKYECKDSKFFARTLFLGTNEESLIINGVGPDKNDRGEVIEVPGLGRRYTDIWLPIICNGDLILGKDIDESIFNPDGFPMRERSEYHTVMKASFKDGQLISFTNHLSEYCESLRLPDWLFRDAEVNDKKRDGFMNRLKNKIASMFG